MLGAGLTERDDEEIRVRDEWLRTTDGRERLRVGTVDSFQGKEFDVVFLSLTRSNNVRGEDDAAQRRRYGFLMLENRLCVAMSRQRRAARGGWGFRHDQGTSSQIRRTSLGCVPRALRGAKWQRHSVLKRRSSPMIRGRGMRIPVGATTGCGWVGPLGHFAWSPRNSEAAG